MPRAPNARSPTVPSPNTGATTAVATSSSSVGRPSTITTSTSTETRDRLPRSSESYHSFAQREEAARILQSYEKLSWYSYARCEVSLFIGLFFFFFFFFFGLFMMISIFF
ncbi:hypothetical protein D0864_15592 [Hortaea werneckii]|uniref:Uncharacterized protein n=1 Tax=Hortaea werneckii TaxID=91943 RepID=A0A3M7BXN0_HORWE|nr:hypothetical protein D0864_15592 [Hortaea werneckii]